MALAALLEDEADLPLSPDGDDDIDAIAGADSGLVQAGPSSPGTPAVEPCLLANEEVMIPSELCLNADIFVDVLNLGWGSLTDQERFSLLKCLPTFPEPENDFQEKLTTLDGLFARADFHFGNPLKQFHASLNAGFYQPDVYRLREISRKLKFHAHLERQQRHAVSLLCDLATSRQQLLLDARCLPPTSMESYRLHKRMGGAVDKKPLAVKRARSRYAKIMFEVRQEACWLDTSSSGEENDDQIGFNNMLQSQFGDMALNGDAADEDTVVRNCLKLRSKSLNKAQKELPSSTSPPTPPLDLNEVLERADMKPVSLSAGKMSKQQQQLNGTSSSNSSLLLNKPKKPGQRRSRLEVLKLQCNDAVRKMLANPPPIQQPQQQMSMAPQPQLQPPPPSQQQQSVPQQQMPPMQMGGVPPQAMMMRNGPSDAIIITQQQQQQQQGVPLPPLPQPQPRSRPQSSVALTPTPPPPGPPLPGGPISSMDPTQQQASPIGGSGTSGNQQREASPPQLPPNLVAATSNGKIESFFHVVHALLTCSPDSRATLTSMEQLVKQWVQLALPNAGAWGLNWLNDKSNWHNELPSALRYMSGTFCPANYPVDFVPLADMNDRSGHWVWLEEEQELSPASSQYIFHLYRCWLDAQLAERHLPLLTAPFRPESEQDMYFFHDQERKRFQVATEPYTYVLTTPVQRELIVGPVRISPSRADSISSSRKGLKDHSILTTERPPAVTVLTLVRDAVARLAGGEGTRTDICNLLRDSQFIRRDLNNHQLTNAVSGALDRLHSERDPCVRFDTTKKLWVYLHRGRTKDDFYRIGQMLMLAAKRRQNRDAAVNAASSAISNAPSSNAPTPTTVNGLVGPPVMPPGGLSATLPPNVTMPPNVLPSPTGKGAGNGSKSNAASRRASAMDVTTGGPNSGAMLQRKNSVPAPFPTEQQAPIIQQPVILPPQMMQAQQLPSPNQQQMAFAGPPQAQMIRGPMPPQQMQQQTNFIHSAPQHHPNVRMMQQQGYMEQQIPTPNQMMGVPPSPQQPGMMPPQMHMPGMAPPQMGPGQMRHPDQWQSMQNVRMMPPQQQQPQQMHYQAPQGPQHGQYHAQMHPMHHGMAPPQQLMQAQQMAPQPMMEQQYYTEQPPMPTNQQQMLMFHHQQAQQQQNFRLVHQPGTPLHPQYAPSQPPQNMMQPQPMPAQFQQHGM